LWNKRKEAHLRVLSVVVVQVCLLSALGVGCMIGWIGAFEHEAYLLNDSEEDEW